MLSKVFTWNDFSVFTETVKAENDKAISSVRKYGNSHQCVGVSCKIYITIGVSSS